MPRYKLPDGTIYNIPEEKVNGFLQKYPDAVTETLGKITPLQEDQTGALAEVNVAPNTDLSLETPSLDSQEKDTAIERTFGKNSLTDFFGDIYRAANKGLEQSSLVDPSINLYREGAEADDKTILNFIKANEETNKNIMQSDEMREFNKIYEEEGGGWWGFVKGAALNPTVLTQELVSSIAMQVGALKSDEVATAATGGLVVGATGAGLATAGVLAVPGGIAGAMGGAMTALETGLTFSELLNKELGNNLTIENVRAFLQNEEKLSDLKNKALGRGLTIGAIELATMGIAKGVGGKIAKAGFKRAGLATAAAIGGIEIAGGAAGEIAGRFVAGQEMDTAEIGFEAFAGLGSAPVSILGQSKNISKGISKIKIDKELANTKYKDISDLFLNEEKTSDTAINLTKIKNSANIIIEEINNKVKKGEITKEQSDKIKENFAITEQANNKLDVLEYQEKDKSEIIDLLKEKSNLEIKIKKVDEASLTKPESDRIQEIVARLNEVAEVNTAKKLKKSVSFAEKAGKALGLETEVLSQEEIRKQYGDEASNSDGFIKNGKIIINEEVARQTEAVTVGSHEVLHGILNKALKGKDANKIVNQFKKVIGKQQLAKIEERLYANDENGKRLYSDEYIAANQDEYFTLFSDAILKNQIEYNENIFTKLGDLIRPILRKLGFNKIKFESGQDVYNFLKEYNKSVKEGALSQDIINLGAEISSEKIQLSKTASEKVQKIFDEKGKDGSFDIIEAYKPLTTKLTNKYRNVPGFEFELLQSEIEIGKRGLLDLINAYDPSKGATLNTYVQGQLANRSIEAANRILDTEFKLDVTEAKGVTDTATAEETIEREEAAPVDEIKSLRKEIGLSEELVTKVKDAVVKTFGTKLPNPQDPKFRFELQKRFRTELKKPLSKFVGKQADYEAFLRDNFESVYSKMPQSLINRRFKEFAEPVLDKNGKQLRERTAEGNKIYVKKKISKAEWIKYFIGADVKSSTKGARKTAIVEGMAEEIAFDATMEVLNDPDVISKYQDIAEITGAILPDNYLAQIAKQIDRNEDFKFSKSILNDSGLSNQELSSILFEGFISAAGKVDPKIIEILLDNAWAKNFPNVLEDFIFPGYKEALKNKTIEEQSDLTRYLINIISRPLRTASYKSKKLEYNTNTRLFRRLEKIAGPKLFGKFKSNALIQLEQIQSQDKNGNWLTKSYIRDKKGIALGASTYNTSVQTFHKDLINNKLSRKEVDGVFSENRNRLKEIIFKLGPKNKGLAISLIKLTQKDQRGLLRSSGHIGGIVQNYNGETVFEHRPPVQYLFEKIVDYIEKPTDAKKEKLNTLLDTAQINVVPKDFADIVDQEYKTTIPSDGKISYENALNKTNYKFDGIFKFSKSLNKDFNKILEQSTDIDWAKRFSPVEARVVGKGKGKKFFIPYSADDFVGLLYATLGKGKVGDQQMEWYKENLLRPFSRGIQQYEAAKQQALRDWQVLKKEAKKNVPGGLGKKNATGLTNQDAVRIYIWTTQGMDIPGTEGSPELVQQNLEIVKNDEKLKAFADRLMALNPEGYPEPSNNWDSGDITTDIVSYINGVKRSEFLTEWKANADEIFSDQNKEKLRALYGDTYIEALEDILYRMRTGTNRKFGASKIEKQFMDWTNNSVGAIMFFNARSAVLQTLSAINFINFSDNNPISAALAFANFPQYVKDFTTLFNSDFLKQRRTGLQTDVNADEIARAAKGSKNTARAMLSALLKFGFTPTQIADSFAIASGGATMYRNRINKYLKEGLSQKEAEQKAFTDFQEIAEETQQSARPDRISSQQASSLGRLILAFGNTPMQYARLTKKATLDLINGRGDWKTNISKIAYYSVIQNIVFSALQQGLFALLFDDEDDDKEKSRLFRIGNSSFDTLLRGIGVYGAAAATVKNMIIEIIEQSEKSRPDYTKIAIEATSLSPPINSKLRKLESAGKTFTYKQSKEKVFTEGFSLENPAFLAGGKVLSAATNLPADRIVQKADHLYTAMQSETELWQAIALSLGWSEWDLSMIEKQTKKSKKFNPRDTNRNINRTVKRKFKR